MSGMEKEEVESQQETCWERNECAREVMWTKKKPTWKSKNEKCEKHCEL